MFMAADAQTAEKWARRAVAQNAQFPKTGGGGGDVVGANEDVEVAAGAQREVAGKLGREDGALDGKPGDAGAVERVPDSFQEGKELEVAGKNGTPS